MNASRRAVACRRTALPLTCSALVLALACSGEPDVLQPIGLDGPAPAFDATSSCTVPDDAAIVSWWPGDGDATDIIGSNDGTPVGGAGYTTGLVGQSFELPGGGAYVDLGNDPSLHLSDGEFTVEAWVRFDQAGFAGDASIVDKMWPDGPNTDGWRLIKQADGHIWFCFGPGGGANGCGDRSSHTVRTTSAVTYDTWYHVAGVLSSTHFRIYLDGVMEYEKVRPVFTDTHRSNLRIGFYNPLESFSDLDGRVDEVTIYNRALSSAEIQGIFDAGSAGKCTTPPNTAPVVAADADPVTVNEGQTASNTGTVSDADGDAVTLTASIGTVTNNNDGTWSWSFATADGPAESQLVTIDADDGNGGTAQTSFDLSVANVAPTVTGVVVPGVPIALADQPVAAGGTFSDPAGPADAPFACTVDHGDGAGPQVGTATSGTCTGPDYTYASAGIYTVTITVEDKDGGSDSLPAENYLVIYDPTGGFVTGGGWIDSPAGALAADASATGKANFGFVSKYKKGASVPTGNTEFNFRAGSLDFHSSSYQWLVVTGGSYAMFKGSGTINGSGDYRFMLWAGDGPTDTFRIKIWTEDSSGTETVVYDNGSDQPIGGGSIVVHAK